MAGPYKDYRLYGVLMLNHLIGELKVGLDPEGVGTERLAQLLEGQAGVSKAALRQEIRSNNTMTNKVLAYLEAEGLVTVSGDARGYRVKVTLEGTRHARRYNRFYLELYRHQIREHYRYRGPPAWVRSRE